jgi:hypothetical protein
VDSWWLIGTPLPILNIFGIYLLLLRVLPAYMEKRKPYNITTITRIYNLFQVAACSYFVYKGYKLNRFEIFEVPWRGVSLDTFLDEKEIESHYTTCWWFIWLRILEFAETIFFILRKKNNQVSFLHVYHHISTVVVLYIFARYSGSE